MSRVDLGTTGIRASQLGLGTVELGLPYGLSKDPPPSDERCLDLLREAVDEGISYIDTAAAYGRSEELVGRAFADHPQRPVVATKVALRDVHGNPIPARNQRLHVEESVRRSLLLLQTDRLDLLKIHSAADTFLHDELVDVMQGLVDRGDVGAWGASTYGTAALTDALSEPKVRVIQVAYSILDRRLKQELLPRARAQGVGIVLRSVFLQGVLSDRRRNLQPSMAALTRAADEAAQIAEDAGLSLSQVALRFALSENVGDIVIVGTARDKELRDNLKAFRDGPLPKDMIVALNSIHVDDPNLLNPSAWPERPVSAS